MNETFKYKNYIGSIEIDLEDKVLHGKVLFINGLITYESVNFDLDELKQEFEASVDEYLSDCKELNIEPEKTCKGQFNVRITPELHLAANLYAKKNNESLNSLVKRALESEVNNKTISHKHEVTLRMPQIIEKHFVVEFGQQEGNYGQPRIIN